MTPNSLPDKRIQRVARLRWIPLAQMKVSPVAQRKLRSYHVNRLAADFDPERVGNLTVNIRDDGSIYIIDGAHRAEGMRQIGWGDQQVQCWTYEGLTEKEEAETFLKLNSVLPVAAFEKFEIGVTAERDSETDIHRIVRAQGLSISRDRGVGRVRSVATLRKVYTRSGGPGLARTLGIIRDAYGDTGLEGPVIDGIGLLCARYNGQLDPERIVERLSSARGGVSGLLSNAEILRKATGSTKPACVAAAAVEIYNQGRSAGKLPSWWRQAPSS